MSVNDASRFVNDDSQVTLQIVASRIDDSKSLIYDSNMFIVLPTRLTPIYKAKSVVFPESNTLAYYKQQVNNSQVMLQIVAPLIDDFRSLIYDGNMFIVLPTGLTHVYKAKSVVFFGVKHSSLLRAASKMTLK